MSEILAHYDASRQLQQDLEDHLFNVARTGKEEATRIGQGDILFLLGLFHDLGKADRAFQDKMLHHPQNHVDHSYAGAKYLCAKIGPYLRERNVDKRDRMTFNELVGYVISAHHGMYDLCDDSDDAALFGFNKFRRRINKQENNYHFDEDVISYAAYLEDRLPDYGYNNLGDLIDKAFDNYQRALSKLSYQDDSEWNYYQSCIVRLYLSLLKNADILDTINAYGVVVLPPEKGERENLNVSYLTAIEAKYASFGIPNTRLNKIRMAIAERVKVRGMKDSTGIYRLDLPTGAGKTNLSMRYAFHQMVNQGKSRFFYITPFLSVLEQNAAEIRKVIGDDGVLEHHSNVVREDREGKSEDTVANAMSDYLIDSWDSQVVLTSMVQFFQTLFKTRSANVRRFSSLIEGVVILDEVQSLPIEVTTLFNLMMNFLSKVMNTTIILCTATQPAYDSSEIDHRIQYGGLDNENSDIVELSSEEREIFSRTELRKYDEHNQKTRLADLVGSVLKEETSILAIFNTKKTVDKCYQLLESMTDRPLYHLSTNMCAQHRLDVIFEIKQQLKDGVPIICVSTQLIEAGVDVDFHRVIRSYAGIDSIVQAAGRCNREGKRQKGEVTLVNLADEEENISRLKEIKAKKSATEWLLNNSSSPIDISLLNRDFFEYYYANNSHQMTYPLGDGESVYDYLTENLYQTANRPFKGKLRQAFKTAGSKLDLINSDTVGVFVPYGEAKEKLMDLEALCESDYPTSEDYRAIKSLLRELQPYTVNIREHDELLSATKSYLNGQILILADGYYDDKKGITKESSSFIF